MTALANYSGRFGAGMSLLVTIPLARQGLGPELFGSWMMLSALMSFFAFMDFGLGNAVINRVAAARVLDDPKVLGRVLASGYFCTAILALFLLTAWAAWLYLASEPTTVAGKVAPVLQPVVLEALNLFVILLAINIPAGLIQKIQLGYQHGHWIGTAQLVSSLITICAIPTVLHYGGGLYMLVIASLGVLVMVNMASAGLWMFLERYHIKLDWSGVNSSEVKNLFKTGSYFLAIQVASALAFQSDAIVITQLLGQAEYGDFAAVQKIFVFATMITSAALLGLWPAFGDALARGDHAWAVRALKHAIGLTLVIMGPICIFLALSTDYISRLWLGTNIAPPLLLTTLLACWAMIEALGMVIGTFLNGAGIIKAQAVVAIAMAALAFIGKWILVGKYGVTGGVLATIIAYCVIAVPAQLYIMRRHFKLTRHLVR